MRAFHNVRDPEARRIIVAIVEAAARGTSVKVEEPSKLGMAIWAGAVFPRVRRTDSA